MRKIGKRSPEREPRVRVNHFIRAPSVRIISETGENLGIMSIGEALKKADEVGLDLIEISPNTEPPIAKIADYGKFQYDQKKKLKLAKTKSTSVEVKSVQIKVGTGEGDLKLKASKASHWLAEGNRVKVELYLRGRAKYLDKKFLDERLNRILNLISEEYTVAEEPKQSPKGLAMVIEKKR